MNGYKSVALVLLYAGATLAVETVGSRQGAEATDLDDDQGSGKLYFTGPGYTINLIPQALLLGLLSFLAVYFLGLDLFGTGATGGGDYGAPTSLYGAPEPSYGAPAASYSAPASGYDAPAAGYSASGRYYDTESYDESRKRRAAF